MFEKGPPYMSPQEKESFFRALFARHLKYENAHKDWNRLSSQTGIDRDMLEYWFELIESMDKQNAVLS